MFSTTLNLRFFSGCVRSVLMTLRSVVRAQSWNWAYCCFVPVRAVVTQLSDTRFLVIHHQDEEWSDVVRHAGLTGRNSHVLDEHDKDELIFTTLEVESPSEQSGVGDR